jgi:3-hydroxyacyl-[acyl-carrier-protein] dehydratase
VKISNVRFRNPVYPGDTVAIEVRRKETVGGFYIMAGTMKRGDTRILAVEFSVAWRNPEAPR